MPSVTLKRLSSADDASQWKQELAQAITSPAQLLRILKLEPQLAEDVVHQPRFRLRVPRSFVAKMHPGDPHDPLLRQVLPVILENEPTGLLDPVGDIHAMATPGLLHKYAGRVLLVTTGACAIHCRYCFRRHFPYSEACTHSSRWKAPLDYIRQHKDIEEVILSGGDPLTLDDDKLSDLCQQLETIPHVKWLRIHTRIPVVLPSRINSRLIEWISQSRFCITFVIHANHANELGAKEQTALQLLQRARVTLLNQSVILKGVNDNAETLINLSKRLHEFGVIPYYLHMFDPTLGAMHFAVDSAQALDIMQNMRNHLPGYLVPRLVKEVAGSGSKTAIFAI